MSDTDLNDLVSCAKCGTVHELTYTKKIKENYSNHWICSSCKEKNWIDE